MTKIEKAMNEVHPSRKDYVWKKNGLYINKCVKPSCKSESVIMKRSVSDGWHVGTCWLCNTKQIEKDKTARVKK